MSFAGLASLPSEVLLQIISYLEPTDIAYLQLLSRIFRGLGRDDNFWRSQCFDQSPFNETYKRRRHLRGDGFRDAAYEPDDRPWQAVQGEREPPQRHAPSREPGKRERTTIMANWDPSYTSEHTSWYEEYVQRHAPAVVSWFEQARSGDEPSSEKIEARGLAIYHPDGPQRHYSQLEAVLAVSPLDDGSVCIWDVTGTKGKRGGILSKSAPGILFVDGPGDENNRRSRRVDSGVTECVSVDSRRHRAFFAVQSHLIEVDLQSLVVVACEALPWSITTLSTASPTVPLTIGTSLGIHLHDPRSPLSVRQEHAEAVDGMGYATARDIIQQRDWRSLFDDTPLAPYAPLSQPTPLSILHLPRSGQDDDISDGIYVAGRFSNILHYDRRRFPAIQGSIHSGASLCSMAALPYHFSAVDSELRQMGSLSLEQVEASKAGRGQTLIAVGDYNTKGSLELYGLTPTPETPTTVAGGLHNSVLKNRQTASSAKLLSVVNHGARIVVSDGRGSVNWFERDGYTEVRRLRIGHSDEEEARTSLFASMPGSGEIARKLLPTRLAPSDDAANDNDLLFWTGDKLGLVGFAARPSFTASDFIDEVLSAEEMEAAKEEKAYGEKMRRALEWQADNVRWVRGLGRHRGGARR